MTCIYGPQGITAMVAKEQIIIATVPVGCGPIVSNQWVGLSFLITPNPPSPSHPERERERCIIGVALMATYLAIIAKKKVHIWP